MSKPALPQPPQPESPFSPTPLKPDELLLVYNMHDPESRTLAEYYARQRKIPENRLVALQIQAKKEEISRSDYERLISVPLRDHLEQHRLHSKVRCLVTFWGLPIRVGPQTLTAEQKIALARWQHEFVDALAEFEEIVVELEAIGALAPTRPPTTAPVQEDYGVLFRRYSQSRIAAWRAIQQSTESERSHLLSAFLMVIQKAEGSATILKQLQKQDDLPETTEDSIERIKQEIQRGDDRIREMLNRGLMDPARNEVRQLIRQGYGLLGLLANLNQDISWLRTDETRAAVDSELSLLWWDHYPKHRWIQNPLNWRWQADPRKRGQMSAAWLNWPVLMVSRLDASTPHIVRRMIDDALSVEQNGLAGKVYLDARGLQGNDEPARYDQNLRDLAHLLWQTTDLRVRLDNRPELLGPHRCLEAMLYCGWYGLRQYTDVFEFVPGAIGYHIASFEAVSLKKADERGWCKGMLESGATATLGPVAEPYLHAFPIPKDFFGLVLTGRFTLAECFAYTNQGHSWMMMLLGDPLYRPFADRPLLTIEQIYDSSQIPAVFRGGGKPR
ncbi:MAG: TIGR03790 family protein [Phycisphaerales bacterium]|nr:TIGR03790 family protein [Phycisphaerales bacterium]